MVSSILLLNDAQHSYPVHLICFSTSALIVSFLAFPLIIAYFIFFRTDCIKKIFKIKMCIKSVAISHVFMPVVGSIFPNTFCTFSTLKFFTVIYTTNILVSFVFKAFRGNLFWIKCLMRSQKLNCLRYLFFTLASDLLLGLHLSVSERLYVGKVIFSRFASIRIIYIYICFTVPLS